MTWTRFMDMYRGGFKKLGWELLYIHAPAKVAVEYIRTNFGVDPVATGEQWYEYNYRIREYPTLEKAASKTSAMGVKTANHLSRDDVLVIDNL